MPKIDKRQGCAIAIVCGILGVFLVVKGMDCVFMEQTGQQNEPMFWLFTSIGLVLFVIGLIFALVLPYSNKDNEKGGK